MKTPLFIMSALIMVFALLVFQSVLLSIPAVLSFIAGYWVSKKEMAVSAGIERAISALKKFYQKLKFPH